MSGLYHPDMTPESIAKVEHNRRVRMQLIDSLDPETRSLVKEYGWSVVSSFRDIGVMKPRHIRHLVETVLDEFSPTRGSSSSQGLRPPGELKGWEPKA